MQWNIPFFLENGLKQGRWNKTKRIGKKGTVKEIEKWKWRFLKDERFQCDAPIRTADPLIWFILQHLCRCGGFELNKNGIIFDIVGTQYDEEPCRFVQRFGYFYVFTISWIFANLQIFHQCNMLLSLQHAMTTPACFFGCARTVSFCEPVKYFSMKKHMTFRFNLTTGT